MGYTTYESYMIPICSGNFNPVDSTAYLLGYNQTNTSSAAYGRIYVPRAGVIRRVYVYWYNSTQDCTAEDTTLTVRVNNTTDATGYTGTFANAAAPQTFEANLPVSLGDYIHFKMTTPAWVTNPTGTFLIATLEVQC